MKLHARLVWWLILFVTLIRLKLAQIFGQTLFLHSSVRRYLYLFAVTSAEKDFGNKIDRMIHSVGIKSSFLSYPVIHSGLKNTIPPLLLEKGLIHHWCVCMLSHFATLWLYPVKFLCPWDSPGKNTGMGCHALLQGTFPTQESNPPSVMSTCLGRWVLYH